MSEIKMSAGYRGGSRCLFQLLVAPFFLGCSWDGGHITPISASTFPWPSPVSFFVRTPAIGCRAHTDTV